MYWNLGSGIPKINSDKFLNSLFEIFKSDI